MQAEHLRVNNNTSHKSDNSKKSGGSKTMLKSLHQTTNHSLDYEVVMHQSNIDGSNNAKRKDLSYKNRSKIKLSSLDNMKIM